MSFRLFAVSMLLMMACSLPIYGQPPAPPKTPTTTPPAGPPKKQEIKPEARVAAQQGQAFLKAKEYAKAVRAFDSAVKIQPNYGPFSHLLGVAHFRNKDAGRAWLFFRRAVLYSPNYKPAVDDFLVVWNTFDRKGVFNMGRSKEQIGKFLGQPDGKKTTDKQEVWQYGFMRLQFVNDLLYAIVDPRGLDRVKTQPKEKIETKLDDIERWQLGYQAVNYQQSLTEFVPKGETTQKWTELYTQQRFFARRGKITAAQLMTDIEKRLKEVNPETEFQVLQNTPEEVLFQWRMGKNKTQAAQYEIVRLWLGESDMHRIAYTKKTDKMPNDEAQKWVDLLRQTKISPIVKSSSNSSE